MFGLARVHGLVTISIMLWYFFFDVVVVIFNIIDEFCYLGNQGISRIIVYTIVAYNMMNLLEIQIFWVIVAVIFYHISESCLIAFI